MANLLNEREIKLLHSLVKTQIKQIVWDLDAFYFVLEDRIIKVEIQCGKPELSKSSDYDELFFISVTEVNENIIFHSFGEEGFWYKVISEQEKILNIEIVRTLVEFPEETLRKPNSQMSDSINSNLVDCGLLIYIESGVIPAVILENSFGFDNWDEIKIYKENDVLSELSEKYCVLNLPNLS